MILALGIASRSSSKSLAPTSTLRMVAPVKLPPGWFKLATKPICTGSLVVVKTIGMVAVATKQPNQWHCRLLSARRMRPPRNSTAEQCDELAPLHSITSSASNCI
jgi:hypothetical protein